MKRSIKKITALLLSATIVSGLVGCTGETKVPEVTYKFDETQEGWIGGFADLPIGEENKEFYSLDFQYADIPVEGKESKGLYITGNNHSDDLFMYITKKVDKEIGLKANTKYKVDLSFDMATGVPGGMMGIGGSPGSSIYVKAGIVNVEPNVVEDSLNYYRFNIDQGSQSGGGKDMTVLGNVEKTDESVDESFQYKSFESSYEVITDENGQAWIVIGTDSGFEGITQLYYDNIEIKFNEIK